MAVVDSTVGAAAAVVSPQNAWGAGSITNYAKEVQKKGVNREGSGVGSEAVRDEPGRGVRSPKLRPASKSVQGKCGYSN